MKIKVPALRIKRTHEIIEAPNKAWSHDQLEEANGIKKGEAKRGFVLENDEFVKRKKAARIALAAKQIFNPNIKKLHTTDLREAEGVKKKVLK